MTRVRVLAATAFVLVGAYFALRGLASACTGTACDEYIPVSLILPPLILVAVAATGVSALSTNPASPWLGILAAATALGVAGPLAALVVFRDNPDRFITSATVIEILATATALVYSARPDRARRRP